MSQPIIGLRSKSIADVNKVGSDLITMRRVIFVPNVDIKEELKKTSINITCYDRNGEVVKRVTSSDDAEIEDNETAGNENENENENGSQSTGGSGSGTTGSGSTETGGSGTNTNGSNDSNGGSDNTGGSGSETGGGDNSGGDGGEDEPGGDDH